jgi:hypothetical protein
VSRATFVFVGGLLLLTGGTVIHVFDQDSGFGMVIVGMVLAIGAALVMLGSAAKKPD